MIYVARVHFDNVRDYMATPESTQLAELLKVADIRTGGEGFAVLYELDEENDKHTLLVDGMIKDCIEHLKQMK